MEIEIEDKNGDRDENFLCFVDISSLVIIKNNHEANKNNSNFESTTNLSISRRALHIKFERIIYIYISISKSIYI